MTVAKLSVSLGSLSFTAEGDEEWLSTQLDKVLENAPELLKRSQGESGPGNFGEDRNGEDPDPGLKNVTLAKFLTANQAGSNQVRRFLVTAEWLRRRGQTRTTTAAVSKALKDNNQKRLTNASECLNKNVAKGYCEKDGNEFFVTTDGQAAVHGDA